MTSIPCARASRGLWMVTGSPLMRICARVGGVGARQGVHQRRLAGAVAADEGDHLARVQVDGDAVDGVDAAEGDTDVAQLDERDALGGVGCGGGGKVGHGDRLLRSHGSAPVWMTMAETMMPATSGTDRARRRRAAAPSRWRPP